MVSNGTNTKLSTAIVVIGAFLKTAVITNDNICYYCCYEAGYDNSDNSELKNLAFAAVMAILTI